jgi:hypothetical protein
MHYEFNCLSLLVQINPQIPYVFILGPYFVGPFSLFPLGLAHLLTLSHLASPTHSPAPPLGVDHSGLQSTSAVARPGGNRQPGPRRHGRRRELQLPSHSHHATTRRRRRPSETASGNAGDSPCAPGARQTHLFGDPSTTPPEFLHLSQPRSLLPAHVRPRPICRFFSTRLHRIYIPPKLSVFWVLVSSVS